ncbi:MAG: hypothetical protein IT176_06410 [Acidobacteria bacterium]|nr:hypothetical protein [Acidobacteriota bacterium]
MHAIKAALTAMTVAVSVVGYAPGTYAQGPGEPAPVTDTQARVAPAPDLPKDAVVATYFSATLPGLGQIYAGHPRRGVLFMASIIGALGAAYAAYEPAVLNLADYDSPAYGGNADGMVSTIEAQNWQNHNFQDTAYERLTTTRKTVLVTGALVGAGLYVWNLFDASAQVRAHNRALAERRVSLGLEAGPHAVGVSVGVNLSPSGR